MNRTLDDQAGKGATTPALTRGMVLGLMLLAAAGPFAYYVREAYAIVLMVVVQEMLYQLMYLVPCYLLGRVVLKRVVRADVNGALGVASSVAMGLGLLGFAVLGAGLAGWLSGGVAWGILIGAAVIGLLDARDLAEGLKDGGARLGAWLRAKSDGGWVWIVPAMLFAIPVVGATLLPGTIWRPDDPHPYDSLIYHLQVPREWIEMGKIAPLKHNVYSYFPFNVEMHYVLGDLLRGSPYAAMQMDQFFSVSFTLLMGLALWGWGKARLGGRAGAILAGAMLSLPWLLMLAAVTYVESGMMLWSALAILWFLEGLRDRRMSQFATAGILCGLACGTKFTGVPMLMFGLPAAALVALGLTRFAECPARVWLRGSVVFGVLGMSALSPWLVRNTLWAGNPVFPNAARVLGRAHFTQTQVERWEKAHGPAAEHQSWPVRGQRLAQQVLANWRFGYVLFPLALVSVVINRKRMDAILCAVLIVVIAVFWLTLTHLMGRFFVMAVLPAGLLVAMLPRKWLTAAAVLIAVSAVNSWVGVTIRWEILPETSNINRLFADYAKYGRGGLYGLQDYSQISVPGLSDRIPDSEVMVLVGDAQVFDRQRPMEKLKYVTVFDLNTDDGRDVYDAYYGPAPEKAPFDVAVYIDESETRRLAKTYWKVPEVPIPPAAGRFRSVVILGPDGQLR